MIPTCLHPDALRLDPRLQARAVLDDAQVERLAALLAEPGYELPPVDVARVDGVLYLAHGWHRHAAHKRAGRDQIHVVIYEVTWAEAVRISCTGNADLVATVSRADKRRMIQNLLAQPEWAVWSDRRLAREIGHPRSEGMVARVRAELSAAEDYPHLPHTADSRRVQRGGQVYDMRTRQPAPSPSERIQQGLREAAELDDPEAIRAKVAQTLGVSQEEVQEARRVLDEGSPELVEEVETGALSLEEAVEFVDGEQAVPDQPGLSIVPALEEEKPEPAMTSSEMRALRAVRRAERDQQRLEYLRRHLADAQLPPEIDLRHGDLADLLAEVEGADLVQADPPWHYNSGLNGSAADHYETVSMETIVSVLDASWDCAKQDTYLLMWCTFPRLRDFFRVANANRFRWVYKSGGAWMKTSGLGTGHHWRGDSEILLLFTKGSPKPLIRSTSNAHASKRTQHSEKPVGWLHELMETFCPVGGRVLDLYAGWAPLARACRTAERQYVGAELDELRYLEAVNSWLEAATPARQQHLSPVPELL